MLVETGLLASRVTSPTFREGQLVYLDDAVLFVKSLDWARFGDSLTIAYALTSEPPEVVGDYTFDEDVVEVEDLQELMISLGEEQVELWNRG